MSKRPSASTQTGSDLEQRAVEVDDPALSPEANRVLTEEVREAVGAERVSVPRDRPHPSQGEHVPSPSLASLLSTHRLSLAITLLAAVTIGAIISLSSGNWWFLVLALGVHALGTTLVAGFVLRLTTLTEHPDPSVVAMLEEEGVANPEERFTEIVTEFSDAGPADAEASDVISPGHNTRSVPAAQDPAGAAAEQRTAFTPTSEPSAPSPLIGAAPLMTWIVPAALLAFSIAIPAVFGGGWMWLVTAVMVPLLAGWVALQILMDEHRGPFKGPDRPRILIPLVVAASVAGVCIFAAIVALVYQG